MKIFKIARAVALIMAAFGFGVSFTASAATIRVPQDQPMVTAGVAAAKEGDTVAVSPGTYNECNIAITKSVTVTGFTTSTFTFDFWIKPTDVNK